MACRSFGVKDTFLDGSCIALSISESPDLAVMGLAKEHLEDAMTEIARHLIACGATLAYGGDLREGGFTELLFEIVNRYRATRDSDKILVSNYLAWPVHVSMDEGAIRAWQNALQGLARLVLLTEDGREIALADRGPAKATPGEAEWKRGLTAMRETMASHIKARIVLGGQTANYRGRLPGIAEEALIQMTRKAPLYVLGGFGGCARDLASLMGISQRDHSRSVTVGKWQGSETFRSFGAAHLNNGLSAEENRQLAETVYPDQAMALVLRGLMAIFGQSRSA
jgi:hypothetical protein